MGAGKRVRFNQDAKHVRECESHHDISVDERTSLWYHANELIAMHLDAKRAGQSIQQPWHIQTNPVSFSNVIQRTYNACIKEGGTPTKQDMDLLVHWTRVSPSRRGLEKFCVPSVTRDRIKRIKYNVKAVLSIQEQLNGTKIGYGERAEMLQKASELVSKSTATYARVRGQADARAVHDDNNNNQATGYDAEYGCCGPEKQREPFQKKRSLNDMILCGPPATSLVSLMMTQPPRKMRRLPTISPSWFRSVE